MYVRLSCLQTRELTENHSKAIQTHHQFRIKAAVSKGGMISMLTNWWYKVLTNRSQIQPHNADNGQKNEVPPNLSEGSKLLLSHLDVSKRKSRQLSVGFGHEFG